MTHRNSIRTTCTAAVLGAMLSASAFAQGPANRITYFTFNSRVELPGGTTLEPGKYTFKLADSASNRHIVQVLDADQARLLATILAVPAERTEPAREPIVTFGETAANEPQPIRYWYYPGDKMGREFVYPREQAMRIAKATRERVLTSDAGSDRDSMKDAKVTTVDASGRQGVYAENRETAASQQASTSSAQQPAPGDEARSAGRLPQTAGFELLICLIGLISMAAFVGLRLSTQSERL